MLRVFSEVVIEQRPNEVYPDRKLSFICPFESSDSFSSWKNLTDTCKIIFPKNVYYINDAGKKVSWLDKTVVNSKTLPPLLLKGDKINVRLGYVYSKDFKAGEAKVFYDDFVGYVAKITPDLSIKVECEDEIWLLKQLKTPKKLFKQSEYDVNKMLKELLVSTDITVETGNITTYVGDYRTNGETVAEVLTNLQKNYNLESYFIIKNGVKILRCSGIVYYPGERTEHVFEFQKNIISHDLEYTRKDDLKLGARAYSISSQENGTNKDGTPKKRKKRLSVEVGEKGGEFRTFYFYNIKTEEELKKLALAKMNRYYFEGYRGKMKVFGIPQIKHGDAVVLQDKTMPERQGTYLVKSVSRQCNHTDGLIQELELDIRIDTMSQSDLANGL